MPDEPNIEQRWREALADVLAPLRAQLDEVEASIEVKTLELKQLRNTRGEMLRVLNAAKPTAKPGPRQSKLQPANATPVSQEKLDALTDYLRTTLDGEVFSGSELLKRDDRPAMSEPTLRGALEHLNAAGVVVVDHVGGPGSSVRKYWKVTRASNG